MATATERNWNYATYVSNDGNSYTLRVSQEALNDANLALAAAAGHPIYGKYTRRRRPRRAEFQDTTTFRMFSSPVGTAAGFAALVIGTTTHAVHVPGLQTAINFVLRNKVDEKVPGFGTPRQLAQDTAAA